MENSSADSKTNSAFFSDQSTMTRKPHVLAVLPSMLPSAVIYIIRPLERLAEWGLIDFSYAMEASVSLSLIRESDVIIFCRNQERKYNYVLEEARMRGLAVIYDLDDNFWEIPQEQDRGLHRLPDRIHQLEHFIRNSDLIRTYSPVLREYIRQYNPRVHMAVPGIDFRLIPEQPSPRQDSILRITYVTGRGNRDTLNQLFIEDLAEVLEIYPDRVEAIVWREVPEKLDRYGNVRIVPIERDYGKFLTGLARAGYDIGLAPLLPDVFHLSKTNTKFRDYGACRIAGIYSKVAVYTDCIEPDRTGILVDQEPGAWRNAMVRLIENDRLRLQIQEAAYQYVYDHYRQEIMEEDWLRLLKSLRLPRVTNDSIPSLQLVPSAGNEKRLEPLPDRLAVRRETYSLPGFQKLKLDLNQPFPIPDNTFRLVFISEPLQEANDLLFTMREVSRVCQHGAQICLFVPYENSQLHQANPKRRQSFNEHTPRYWTNAAKTPVYERVFAQTDGEPWGMLDRLDPTLDLDLRCQKITFFYTPAFRDLSEEEKRSARQTKKNVCDYILYHLIVIKQPAMTEEEMQALERQTDYFEPPEVAIRQYHDLVESQKAEIKRLKTDLMINYQEMERIKGIMVDQEKDLQLYKQKNRELLVKLEGFRQNKAFKILWPLLNRSNAWPMLPEAFKGMKTDTITMVGKVENFLLQPGHNLNSIDFIEYPVSFPRPNLVEIHLAVVLDISLSKGRLGIELVSPQGQIVAQEVIRAEELAENEPVVFKFSAVEKSEQGKFRLRVFVKEVDAPVRIFELRDRRLLNLGRARKLPFIGFRFLDN